MKLSKVKLFSPQAPSQYGFLTILIYAFLTKTLHFNLFYLPFLNWLFYLVEYGIIFFILFRISRSLWLPVLGIFFHHHCQLLFAFSSTWLASSDQPNSLVTAYLAHPTFISRKRFCFFQIHFGCRYFKFI